MHTLTDLPDAIQFLRGPEVAVLSTVDGEGRPSAACFWYLLGSDSNELTMQIGAGSRTRHNIESNRWVSVVIARMRAPYYALYIRGTASIGAPLSLIERRAQAERYLGSAAEAYLRARPHVDAVTTRVKVEVASVYAGFKDERRPDERGDTT